MNWQAMMKHEAGCKSGLPIRCRECKFHQAGNGCTSNVCPKGPCTCHRDEYVTAIEAVFDEAKDVADALSKFFHGYEEGICEAVLMGLQAALDRLNVLAGGVGGKEGE